MTTATEAQLAHLEIIGQLDLHSRRKAFRNPNWRPNQRRNKNIKAIMLEAQKREAAGMSAAVTPLDDSGESGASTPADASECSAGASASTGQNLTQASQSLSKLVLERNLRESQQQQQQQPQGTTGPGTNAPVATYTNIEAAPSLGHPKHYCDITGLPAPYLDPKTRLRYHNREVFRTIRELPPGVAEQYLEARGAHTVLK